MVKNDYLRFGDEDLKDARTDGDDDQDGIQAHKHYDNLSIFAFGASSNQDKYINIQSWIFLN